MFADWRTAPVDEKLRAALGLVNALTNETDPREHVDALRREGASDEAIEDVIVVCTMFNVVDRLADAFEFDVLSDEQFAKGAKVLLKMGYSFPAPVWMLAARD